MKTHGTFAQQRKAAAKRRPSVKPLAPTPKGLTTKKPDYMGKDRNSKEMLVPMRTNDVYGINPLYKKGVTRDGC